MHLRLSCACIVKTATKQVPRPRKHFQTFSHNTCDLCCDFFAQCLTNGLAVKLLMSRDSILVSGQGIVRSLC